MRRLVLFALLALSLSLTACGEGVVLDEEGNPGFGDLDYADESGDVLDSSESALIAADSYESDNSISTAKLIEYTYPVNGVKAQRHTLHSTSDVDYLKVYLTAGKNYTVKVVAQKMPKIELRNSSNTLLKTFGLDNVWWSCPKTGYYYVRIAATTTAYNEPYAVSVWLKSSATEPQQAQALLQQYLVAYPILAGATVTFGDARGYQAICYYSSGRVVISPSHTASLDRILRHELWHAIDWRINQAIDWGESLPPSATQSQL